MRTGSDAQERTSSQGTAAEEPGHHDVVRSPGGRQMLAPVLWVMAVGAVVTIAANGIQLLMPAAALAEAWVLAVRVAGALLVAAGLAGLMVERARLTAEGPQRRDPTVVGLRAAATIMCVVALLSLANPPAASTTEGPDGPSVGLPGLPQWGSDGPGGAAVEARSRGGESLITGEGLWLPDAITLPLGGAPAGGLAQRLVGALPWLFVLAMLLMGLRLLLGHARVRLGGLENGALLVPDDAEESLEASLAEVVRYSGDPRGQITRAYGSLLSALALAGAPREPQEAPHEHLRRALAPMGVRPGPLHRLAALYVLAQFGARPVTERHRIAAVDALEASLADLRRAVRPAAARPPLASAGSV